jgi:tRNA (guanine37-N1)-methyltransferase
LKIDLLTLFPGMVRGFLEESILGRAARAGILELRVHNLRDWAGGKHQVTDDRPFGGGAGMVLKPEPVFAAFEDLRGAETSAIYLAPDGEPLKTPLVKELAREKHLLLLSGHYEGVDQRVRDCLIDREISIGDYVLTNGTLAAAVLVDAVARHIPGVLGEEKSLTQDSYEGNVLSFPQYTRPAEFRGMKVPDVLLSGDHGAIERWRQEMRARRTREIRPDLHKERTNDERDC